MNKLSLQPDEARHPLTTPLFADMPGDFEISFEFFPPKTEKMDIALWEAVQSLAPLRPRFVSVTYGADGSTRDRTHATVARLATETDGAGLSALAPEDVDSSMSPVAILAIMTTAPITSAGCFSPLGPFGVGPIT